MDGNFEGKAVGEESGIRLAISTQGHLYANAPSLQKDSLSKKECMKNPVAKGKREMV